MIGIQNVGKVNSQVSTYEVFIFDGEQRKDVVRFNHKPNEGLGMCLHKAWQAVEKDKWGKLAALVDGEKGGEL